jgi:hypothetical protein
LQYAVEFAAISRHVDPESERWENMANEYFSQVFPDDKFDAPDPDDVREAEQKKVDAAMAEVRRLEEKVADCEGRVAVDTKRANEASVRVNAADEASDEYDALVSRHEKLSTVAFNSERSLEDAKASLRRAKKEAEDARKHRDEQIERAEKLQSDKLSHDEATEANRIRRDGAISMSRNFVACARQAEAFGNTPGEAWDAVTKGVGKGITAWADDDVDNFRFAKAAHEHAASRTLRFAHVYCDNDEWEKVDPTPTAEDYATNVFEVVRDRYSKKKSYGEQAAERFGMDYDDIESDPYEDYYGGN